MIKPLQKDSELIADIESRNPSEHTIDIWWLGQSGYLIHWNGIRMLLDPYLSDSLSNKYHNTNKPHIRMSELVVNPKALKNIDFITSSHAHTDHLDPGTLSSIFRNNPYVCFIIPEAHRSLASQRAVCEFAKPIGLNIGQKFTLGLVSFTAIPAAHETFDKDEFGHALYLGYIIQLGPWCLYHSGDTIYYPSIEDLLKAYPIDISFLPINGADPSHNVAGNLNASEAVQLAEHIKTRWVIPGHYHMFEFNTVDPDEFISLAQKANIQYKVMRLGERFTLNKLPDE